MTFHTVFFIGDIYIYMAKTILIPNTTYRFIPFYLSLKRNSKDIVSLGFIWCAILNEYIHSFCKIFFLDV